MVSEDVVTIWAGPKGVVLGNEEAPDGLWVRVGWTYKGHAPATLDLARAYRKTYAKAVNDAVTTSVASGWSSVNVDAVMFNRDGLVVARGAAIDELESILWRNAKPGLVRFNVSEDEES